MPARPALAAADIDGSHERTLVTENTIDIGDSIISDTKEGGAGCLAVVGPADPGYVMLYTTDRGTTVILKSPYSGTDGWSVCNSL